MPVRTGPVTIFDMLQISKINPEFTDSRGVISRLLELDNRFKAVLLITSKAGAIRANHYHTRDIHYTYLVSGKFEYTEKGIDDSNIESQVIESGDLVITPAKRIHAMKFLEDSVIIVLTTEPRDQKMYEKDTVRVKLV